MAARIGARIREVLEILESRGPSTMREVYGAMPCNVSNTSKYCHRAVALELATTEIVELKHVFTAAPNWRVKVGPKEGGKKVEVINKNVGITAAVIRKRRADAGNVWAGL